MAKEYLKEAMVDAFKKLARKKSIQKITIGDIVTECDISKQTFYNYFKDKNDLILYTCTLEGKRCLESTLNAGLNYKAAISCYYKNALPLKYFYSSFIYDTELQLLLFDAVAQTSIEYMKHQIKHYYGNTKLTPEIDLAIKFNAAGNSMLFLDWIANNMTETPDIMAEANFSCIPESLKNYFNCEEIATI